MLPFLLFLICCRSLAADEDSDDSGDSGMSLVASLRNDANLDLSVDEEYEDLRAELLAYHSALASLVPSRRSMISTSCWRHGGICISYKLCPGYRQLTEVPGCKNRFNVCCFVWNKYEVRDLKDKGIGNIAFPWSQKQEYGGEGVIQVTPKTRKKRKKENATNTETSKTKLSVINIIE
ncbi:uncharacterized protein LOC124542825 [Vanessa cardui]|uniref:uncharacterized protein LOC124542825 n=1 Tax=Vanessa cardui TaxID=171605 RepID=UPI001F13AC76|nr:uncharacterized protein LOC124542825 [Vanessa cardui]